MALGRRGEGEGTCTCRIHPQNTAYSRRTYEASFMVLWVKGTGEGGGEMGGGSLGRVTNANPDLTNRDPMTTSSFSFVTLAGAARTSAWIDGVVGWRWRARVVVRSSQFGRRDLDLAWHCQGWVRRGPRPEFQGAWPHTPLKVGKPRKCTPPPGPFRDEPCIIPITGCHISRGMQRTLGPIHGDSLVLA